MLWMAHLHVVLSVVIDYMDMKSLSSTYIASFCNKIKSDVLKRIKKIGPYPDFLCALSDVGVPHSFLVRHYRFDITRDSLHITSDGTIMHCIIDHCNRKLQVKKMFYSNIKYLIELWHIMQHVFIELMCDYYIVCKHDDFNLTTDSIRTLDLSSQYRPSIAIPINISDEVKVDNIGELATFQDKFIIF